MGQEELFDAIRNNDVAAVTALLDETPSLINARQNDASPILFAIYNGHPELVAHFRLHKPLTFPEACAAGDLTLVRQMLDGDLALLHINSDDGFPPLGLACFFRHPEVAGLLIERGADVNVAAENALRVAPLHSAAAVQDHATMRRLLDHGANPNARQQMGFTPLHTAAQHGDLEMIDLLLAHGADPTVAADDGRIPADLAGGNPEVVKRLQR